jgi:hypothetical protein
MAKRGKERSLTRQAFEWISSPEGQKKLEEASREAEELIEYLREVQALDPKVLNEPITL